MVKTLNIYELLRDTEVQILPENEKSADPENFTNIENNQLKELDIKEEPRCPNNCADILIVDDSAFNIYTL